MATVKIHYVNIYLVILGSCNKNHRLNLILSLLAQAAGRKTCINYQRVTENGLVPKKTPASNLVEVNREGVVVCRGVTHSASYRGTLAPLLS